MKKIFQKSISMLVPALFVLISLTSSASAEEWIGTVGTGGASITVGSDGAFKGMGGGMGGSWTLSNPYGLPSGSIMGIVSNLLYWLLTMFGIIGVIGFVISGIMYLLASGDESLAEKGKEGMKWSIIGVIVGLSGYIILQAAEAMLSADKTF